MIEQPTGDNGSSPRADSPKAQVALQHQLTLHFPHLHPCVLADHCLQAKITLPRTRGSLLHSMPELLADILRSEHFYPDTGSASAAGRQYCLEKRREADSDFSYRLMAAPGPSFISFWFRNTSESDRFAAAASHAMERLDHLCKKFEHAIAEQNTPTLVSKRERDTPETGYNDQ